MISRTLTSVDTRTRCEVQTQWLAAPVSGCRPGRKPRPRPAAAGSWPGACRGLAELQTDGVR